MPTENKPPDQEKLQQSLLNIAIEAWRFSRSFKRICIKLDAGEQKKHLVQFNWFQKKIKDSLDNVGLWIKNVEDSRFDPGMAATPLNIEEFDSEDTLFVEQMREPIIMGPEGVIKTGTVILRKEKP